MMRLSWVLLILSLMSSTVYGLRDDGPLYKTMVHLMDKYPHLQTINMTHAVKSTSLRNECQWILTGSGGGDSGIALTLIVMESGRCDEYTEHSWVQALPCAVHRGSNHSTCRGPLPEGLEEGVWKNMYIDKLKTVWTNSFAPRPAVRKTESSRFVGRLNCEDLTGLVLARAIQRSGAYSGNGTIRCMKRRRCFDFTIQGPKMHFFITIPHKLSNFTKGTVKNSMFWESWFDNQNRLVVTINGGSAVRYTKTQLSAQRLTLDGKKRRLNPLLSTTLEGEPRLCALSAMSSACAIMNRIMTEPDNSTCNVTGFQLHEWTPYNDYVIISGYALGTRCVAYYQYTASIVDTSEAAWMELPMTTLTSCEPRVYKYADCSTLTAGAPTLDSYQLQKRQVEMSLVTK